MSYQNQRSIEEEAKSFYVRKMDKLFDDCRDNPSYNVIDMKQKHMEFKFDAVDHLRKKSIEMANTWKLEKDLNDHYTFYAARLREHRNSYSD